MMRFQPGLRAATSLAALCLSAGIAMADEQAAINGCRDQLLTVGGPDAQNGIEITSSEFSEAGTMVHMRDAGGTNWECIGYSDGAVGDLRVVEAADDGAGAMAGGGSTVSGSITVHFQPGTSGATYDGTLAPGDSVQYVLGAQAGQDLSVNVRPQGAAIDYQIFNPDKTFLLDMISTDQPYRGELWQSGDRVVEVINRTNTPQAFFIEFAIQ